MSLIDNVLACVIMQAPLSAGWRVERMAARDLGGVAAVELAALKFLWSCGNFEDSFKSGHLTIVLCDGGNEIAGYLIPIPVVDEMHLLNVTVVPAWQRQGLGHWLLHPARVLTLAHGLGSLLLEVYPSNAGAVAPYHRNGLAEIGRHKRCYPAENNAREDALIMRMVCETSGAEVA